jgi:uncharacterized protein (TIGR00255 family)
MTGFGRGFESFEDRRVSVEIKTVNHRYFEFSPKLPRAYGFLDEKIKSLLQTRISRGKVDVGVTLQNTARGDTLVEFNEPLAAGYIDALREANARLGLNDDITLSSVVRLPDVFSVAKNAVDEEAVWADVKTVAETALRGLLEMRAAEGKKLADDLSDRLSAIEGYIANIELLSPETTENYRNRLAAKLTELLGNARFDEQRVLTEAAVFAEKTATDEETVRLRSHVGQCRDLLLSGGTVGRKLDFLIQEFNREANTIGSKSQSQSVTRIVVDLKSEIEKIREQVQNIE